jgi:maleate isomerase
MEEAMALLERTDAPARSAPAINIGQRLRIGMMIPSVNFVADPQIQAMLPEGVQLHTTRMKLVGASDEEMQAMVRDVDRCAGLLADADPHRILFHCTAASTISVDMGPKICARIKELTGIPATDTAEAVLSALDALGARRIVLVSPYPQSVNDHEVEFFGHFGIEVVREHGLQLSGGRAFAQVTPEDWHRIVLEHRHDAADAYFISCAQVRAAEVIESLERELQRPVITSNTAVAWRCLRQSNIGDRIDGFGALMRM